MLAGTVEQVLKPAKCGREAHGKIGKKSILRQWCAMRWDLARVRQHYRTTRCIFGSEPSDALR